MHTRRAVKMGAIPPKNFYLELPLLRGLTFGCVWQQNIILFGVKCFVKLDELPVEAVIFRQLLITCPG